jgi:hypothetical protein
MKMCKNINPTKKSRYTEKKKKAITPAKYSKP